MRRQGASPRSPLLPQRWPLPRDDRVAGRQKASGLSVDLGLDSAGRFRSEAIQGSIRHPTAPHYPPIRRGRCCLGEVVTVVKAAAAGIEMETPLPLPSSESTRPSRMEPEWRGRWTKEVCEHMNSNLRYRRRAASIPAGRCRGISLFWNSSIRTLTEPARGCSCCCCCCTSTYTESGYGYRLGFGAAMGLADINEPAVCAWRSCPARTAGPHFLSAAAPWTGWPGPGPERGGRRRRSERRCPSATATHTTQCGVRKVRAEEQYSS